jgi:hypothetical protein
MILFENRWSMKIKLSLIIMSIVFFSCNANKIVLSYEEYTNLLNENSKFKKENNLIKVEYNDLQRKYNDIINKYNTLNKEYQIIKNMEKIIEYENSMSHDFVRIAGKTTYDVLVNGGNNLLFDYYNNGYYIFGLTAIEGYYVKEKYVDGDNNEVEYDAFVITNGEKLYLDSITKLQMSGNTIYDITEKGDPIAIIKIDQINNELKNKIVNSTEKNKIQLKILLRHPFGSDNGYPTMIEVLDIL